MKSIVESILSDIKSSAYKRLIQDAERKGIEQMVTWKFEESYYNQDKTALMNSDSFTAALKNARTHCKKLRRLTDEEIEEVLVSFCSCFDTPSQTFNPEESIEEWKELVGLDYRSSDEFMLSLKLTIKDIFDVTVDL